MDVVLYIRDDMSKDNTSEILSEYASKFTNIILLHADENLGACRSFLKLMCTEIDSNFFALADQDDIWDEDKLAVGIHILKSLPQDKPALYYSNVRVTDAEGNVTRLAHKEPQVAKNRWAFLAEPLAQGCTCIYNKELAKIIWHTQPTTYSMHDTYIYNLGAMFGNVVYDFEPHMNYRQHESNVIGIAKRQLSCEGLKRQAHYYLNWKDQPRYETAQIMAEQWKDLMNDEQKNMVSLIVDYKKVFAIVFVCYAVKRCIQKPNIGYFGGKQKCC